MLTLSRLGDGACVSQEYPASVAIVEESLSAMNCLENSAESVVIIEKSTVYSDP
jgi:hypothetical protein